jgi:3-hydroxyacyl-[acyl-carrier-protein] dehydratase
VTLARGDERGATATVSLAPNDPVFRGHFPGLPVLPGIFLIHFADQVMQGWYGESRIELGEVMRCRLLGPVRPGDDVTVEVTVARSGADLQCAALVRTGRGPAADIRLRYREVPRR